MEISNPERRIRNKGIKINLGLFISRRAERNSGIWKGTPGLLPVRYWEMVQILGR